ncbi:reverse transcriptase domain-containing protein [Tanacetum coccineum]
MITLVEKRNHAKFCEFHGEVGYTTDECMHLKKQIEEMLKAGKLSHLIKQNNRKEQPNTEKKWEPSGKDKALAILMVQPWERVAKQKITQSFSSNPTIFFPPLDGNEGTEGPMIIEAKIGEIKNQLVPATTPLIGFSGKIIWPIGQIQLLVKIGDGDHSTSAWMNFVVVRSPSPYNGIIGRSRVRKLQAVSSIAHRMLKLPVEGGVITLKSSRLVPLECALISGSEGTLLANKPTVEERIKVAINPEYPEQTIMIDSTLTKEGHNKLCDLLQRNLDIFAWKPADMTGVPRHIAEHRLNVRKMPFGLRNARATYQRLVDKAFYKKIGRNLEVYVDDLVIKSRTEDEIVKDIEETFQNLREINMKLNPKKCTFELEEGMFLGYKVSTRGLKLASLNQFLAKSAEKLLPLFKTLKKCTKKSDFYWTREAEEAFKQMKWLIVELPMLVALVEKEELIVYLAAAKEMVSAVLMTEREAKQMPVYFVSMALRGPKINYTSMEKLVLALVHASKSLKRYFQAHPIIVITDQPIQQVLSRPEVAGRFNATNNEAEYESLIAGLKIAEQMGIKNLQENVDSRLVANQVNGTCVAKETDMILYLEKVNTLTSNFKAFSIKKVPRSENKKVGALSKIASISFAHLSKQVLVEELKEKSISATEVLEIVEEEGDTWMTPIFKYLTDGTLLAEVKKARAHACRHMIRRGKSLADWLLLANHARGRKNANKSMPSLSERPGKVKFLMVAIDYFTKWIEAKPVTTITGNQIKKIMWDNIVCRFELPGEIISDNGKQFQDNPFKYWCEKLCICQHFASVKHPQTNGLVERANRSLGEGIKARLDERSKNWMEELPHVLWAHCTMIKSSNGDTLFSLTYGMEAVILAEIGMPTLRKTEVDLVQNNEALEINLDLLEERREQTAIREAKSKEKMEKYYNSKVRSTSFKPGDLVYRNNEASCAEDTEKLGPKWERPYEVMEALRKVAYKLKDRDGNQLQRTWNISNLKKCYSKCKQFTHADSAVGVMHSNLSYSCIAMFSFF